MGKKIKNWEQIFEQYHQSGKSIPEFCKEIGIHPNTFYQHRKKTDECRGSIGGSVVEVKPVTSVCAAPIVLQTKKFSISITDRFNEALLISVLKIIGEL